MTDIELKKMEPYTIFVQSWDGKFVAKIDDHDDLTADTLPKLEEMVKRQIAADRHFKPLDVIRIGDGQVGRITSFVSDKTNEVYFTFKELHTYRERGTKDVKEALDDKPKRVTAWLIADRWRTPEEPTFALVTPENLEIVAKLRELEKAAMVLQAQAEELRASFKDKVFSVTKGGAK